MMMSVMMDRRTSFSFAVMDDERAERSGSRWGALLGGGVIAVGKLSPSPLLLLSPFSSVEAVESVSCEHAPCLFNTLSTPRERWRTGTFSKTIFKKSLILLIYDINLTHIST